ncbi:MAG TPA: LPS export ABC transporter ATP-binding protein [Spirochaetales bacterium]|nr:LPS export ABC transporter ATP-binding protein [Spirochaetales bacterium]
MSDSDDRFDDGVPDGPAPAPDGFEAGAPPVSDEAADEREDERLEDIAGPRDGVSHVLEARGLRKAFGKKVAVADVSFSMRNGEVVGLLGPNGAGKTTVFYMIVGFLKPDSGGVLLDSGPVDGLPMHRRARMGLAYLPQDPSIFRKMSVEDNIAAVLETRTDLDAAGRKRALEELLEEFGVAELRKQAGWTLSGGERRRTEIARALAIRPKFLLLDEPFAGIDPIAVQEIKRIVRRLSAKGIGVLLTDHNVRDTLDVTHRAYVISRGTILVSGTRADILASEMARKVYLGDGFSM